jgi:hypothetical protein
MDYWHIILYWHNYVLISCLFYNIIIYMPLLVTQITTQGTKRPAAPPLVAGPSHRIANALPAESAGASSGDGDGDGSVDPPPAKKARVGASGGFSDFFKKKVRFIKYDYLYNGHRLDKS